MNQHFYECAQDSELGKKITKFWEKCIRCEREAEKYAKAMGAVTYYEDPSAFAGGCVCVAFPKDARIERGVWRLAGRERDGEQTPYYEPDVEHRLGYAEIPHRDYALKDTFDRIYHRDRILMKEGKLYVPYTEFYRDEHTGTRNDIKGGRQPRTASKGLRKAIKAERLRMRLPVMKTEDLLAILGATATDAPAPENHYTPTFFPYRSRYFIGCPYSCSSADLLEITPQIYRMNQDKYQREMARSGS